MSTPARNDYVPIVAALCFAELLAALLIVGGCATGIPAPGK